MIGQDDQGSFRWRRTSRIGMRSSRSRNAGVGRRSRKTVSMVSGR